MEGAEVSTWFMPLAKAYGWQTSWLPSKVQFSSYATTTSWLVPDSAVLVTHQPEGALVSFLPPLQPAKTFPQGTLSPMLTAGFGALDPAISLTMVEAPAIPGVPRTLETLETLDASLADPESATLGGADWQQWNAVGAVRIVDSSAGESAGTELATGISSKNQCLEAPPHLPYQAQPIAMTAAPRLQIWVYDQYIGEVTGQVSAQRIVRKLRSQIQSGQLNPGDIRPLFGKNFAAASVNTDILFVVDETMRTHPELPAAAVAVQWVNNLRIALDADPLNLAQVQMAMQGLQPTGETLYGTASWYGPGFHGRKTANGERFNQYELTAAHKTLPFGTRLQIRNRLNGKTVVVRINDRGPYIGQRTLDLSKAAAQCLGSESQGVIPYEAVMLEPAATPEGTEWLTVAAVSEQ